MAYVTPLTGSGANAMAINHANVEEVRICFAGASEPSPKNEGQFWLDTSVTPPILKQYLDNGGGLAWEIVGTLLHGDLDCDLNQLINARFENTATSPTPDAGNVGYMILHTGEERLQVVVSASEFDRVVHGNSGDLIPIDLFVGQWKLDATNPPTEATKGSTPTTRGLLFDAVNELASIQFRIPQGFTDAHDIKLRLFTALNQAETAGDDEDWTADLVAVQPDNGEGFAGTSTQAVALVDLGSHVADGDSHQIDITLDYDDATNPLNPGDLVTVEIHRTNLTEVGGVILTHAQALFPFGGTLFEV